MRIRFVSNKKGGIEQDSFSTKGRERRETRNEPRAKTYENNDLSTNKVREASSLPVSHSPSPKAPASSADRQSSRPPFLIIFFFGLILLLATVNLVQDMDDWGGLRPFGFLNSTSAQQTVDDVNNLTEFATFDPRAYNIEDSPDRCNIINSHRNDTAGGGVGEGSGQLALSENIGGINAGLTVGSVDDGVLAQSSRLGNSYSLGIAVDPTLDVGATIDFINRSAANGLNPIVRLCYVGGCNFNGADDISNFYAQVKEGTNANFIATVGPNEPGTGTPLEYAGFGYNNYSEAVQGTNAAASNLKARFGDDIILSAGAINVTNAVNNDVTGFAQGLNAGLYDYIFANSYEGLGPSAYDFYANGVTGSDADSLKAWVDANGLDVIFTEYGHLNNPGAFGASIEQICSDSSVAGLMFYRPFASLPIFQPEHEIDEGSVARALQSCGAELTEEEVPQCTNPEIIGGQNIWDTCPYDTVIYNKEYANKSVADACGSYEKTIVEDLGEPESILAECVPRQLDEEVCYEVEEQVVGEELVSGDVIAIGDSNVVRNNFYENKIARDGATSQDLLVDSSLIDQINALSPGQYSHAVINVGTNDCTTGITSPGEYLNNMVSLATLLYEQKAILPIFTEFPAGEQLNCGEYKAAFADLVGTRISDITIEPGDVIILNSLDISFNEQNYNVENGALDQLHLNSDAYERVYNAALSRAGESVPAVSDPDQVETVIREVCFSESLPFEECTLEERENGAHLKLECQDSSGEGCISQKLYTQRVGLPIGLLGGNSPIGNEENPYSSVCAKVGGSELGDIRYDAFNQFAGAITAGGVEYPASWLGNALNCSADLNVFGPDFAGENTVLENQISSSFESVTSTTSGQEIQIINSIPSTGSYTEKGLEEIENEEALGVIDGVKVIDERGLRITGGQISTLENEAFSYNDFVLEKGLHAESIRPFRPYNPVATRKEINSAAPAQCQETKTRFIADSEIIEGPEANLTAVELADQLSYGQVCMAYAARFVPESTAQSIDPIDYHHEYFLFGDHPNRNECSVLTCDYASGSHSGPTGGLFGYPSTSSCPILLDPFAADAAGFSYLDTSLDCINSDERFHGQQELLQSGECYLPKEFHQCFQGINVPPEAEIFFQHDKYANPVEPDIPGAYDALFAMHEKLQNRLSARNMKINFRENVGWRSEVTTFTRDGHMPYELKPYEEDLYLSYSSLEDGYRPANLFQHDYHLGLTHYEVLEYQYYEWLGTMDLIQEMLTSYSLNNTFQAEEVIVNPFFENPSFPTLNEKEFIVTTAYSEIFKRFAEGESFEQILASSPDSEDPLGGLLTPAASLFTSYPFITCDEVEWLKYQEGIPEEYLFLEEDLPTCVTLISDESYQNNLGNFLCAEGYSVDGVCKGDEDLICRDLSDELSGKYDFVTCPLRDVENSCFQGPYGDFSHCDSRGLPIDINPSFPTVSPREGRDFAVVAPTNGTIVDVNDYSSVLLSNGIISNQGFNVVIESADTGIFYSISHLSQSTVPEEGTRLTVGQEIAQLCTTDCDYGFFNAHAHISAYLGFTKNGNRPQFSDPIDPYLIFGDIHGCNAQRPDEGATYGSQRSSRDQCGRAETNALQDNGSCRNSKTPPIDDGIIIQRFNSVEAGQSNETTQTENTQSGNLIAVQSTDSGVIATIDSSAQFVAKQYTSTVPISQFVSETGSTLASNGPLRNRAVGFPRPEGLVAQNGEITFNDTQSGLTHAIVFHDGSLKKNISASANNATYFYPLQSGLSETEEPVVVAATDRFAIIYIFDWNTGNFTSGGDFTKALREQIIESRLQGHVDIAISGAALIVADGVEVDENQINFNDNIKTNREPRTVIGWNAAGDLVIADLISANIADMKAFARENGITTLLSVDGGGSTQMYYENGFSNIVSDYNNSVPVNGTLPDSQRDQVYWVGRQGETGPRARDWFLGAIDQVDPNAGSGDIYDPLAFCAAQNFTGIDSSNFSSVGAPPELSSGGAATAYDCFAESGTVSPNQSYSNVYEMVKRAGEIMQVDPAMMATILQIEHWGLTQTFNNPEVSIDKIYGGNPNQFWPAVNPIGCIGPGQFCPNTAPYYFLQGNSGFSQVEQCARELGVSVNEEDGNICPQNLGNAICGAMALLSDRRSSGSGIEWTAEQRFRVGGRYYGGSCSPEVPSSFQYCNALKGVEINSAGQEVIMDDRAYYKYKAIIDSL